jgi:SNF2 family DNA or RNA helicase
VTVLGTQKKRIEQLTNCKSYAIINYEGILSIGECSIWNDFDMVVLDESSRIKNHKAKRTKAIINIFAKTPYKYILSGTPITQSPMDIYCQYQFLNPSFLPFKNYYACRGRYCVMESAKLKNGATYWTVIRYRNLSELKQYIAMHSIQLKKEDCMDLPPKVYQKRMIDISSAVKKQYNEMKRNLMIELAPDKKISVSNALNKLQKLQQILSGQFLADQKDNNKLTELIDIISNTDKQLVIWCFFRPTVQLLCKMCEDLKIPYSCMYGATEDRAEQRRRFQDGESRVFIGQIRTGGMGITLTAGHTVIIYENTFSLEDRKQFEDRVHRPGQTHKCTYIDLVYKKTIDEKVLSAIRKKQDMGLYLVKSFLKGEY